VVAGERPSRPPKAATIGLTDDVWELLEGCWQESGPKRVEIPVILGVLSEAASRWHHQSPALDDDRNTESGSDASSDIPGNYIFLQ
jgi:hypothetical protein